jgi:hypothetical protein
MFKNIVNTYTEINKFPGGTTSGNESNPYRGAVKLKQQSLYRPGWPIGFQEVKVPRFRDNGTGWWQGCHP